MLKKKWFIVIGALVALGIIGALFGNKEPAKTQNNLKQPEIKVEEKQVSASKINNDEESKKLAITLEAQDSFKDGKQKVVLWTTNNSQYVLKSATINVRSTDERDKTIDSDVVWPENIESSKRQYGILWMKTNTPPIIKYDLSKAEFQE